MSKGKKARREAAKQRAELRKKIIIAGFIGAAIALLLIIVLYFLFLERPDRDTADVDVRIDIDLTVLGDNMMRAESVNILSSPGEFLDKVIKVNGAFFSIFEPTFGKVHNIISVFETDACCPPQGFDIIVGDFSNPIPFDFPADGTRVEVVGVFSTYEESGHDFYYLAVDDVIILD